MIVIIRWEIFVKPFHDCFKQCSIVFILIYIERFHSFVEIFFRQSVIRKISLSMVLCRLIYIYKFLYSLIFCIYYEFFIHHILVIHIKCNDYFYSLSFFVSSKFYYVKKLLNTFSWHEIRNLITDISVYGNYRFCALERYEYNSLWWKFIYMCVLLETESLGKLINSI